MEDGAYMNILAGYHSSIFQDFESYLRTEIALDEDDIGLVLDIFNSSFFSYELQPGIHIFKDLSESVFNILHNLNVQNLTAKLLLNLLIIPGKLNWLKDTVF